jgi:thiol-disulfide isomerase/thioredoxin
MKIKHLFFILILSFNSKISSAQVKLLSLDQLEKRIELGNDTVFVINFWATWCAPCVKEIPNFEKLNSTYKPAPIKVILVSLDFKSKLERVVVPFVKKNRIKSEVYLLNEKSEQDYIDRISTNWAGSLPATLVINNQKGIRRFFEQEFTWEELEKVYLENK